MTREFILVRRVHCLNWKSAVIRKGKTTVDRGPTNQVTLRDFCFPLLPHPSHTPPLRLTPIPVFYL